MERIGIKDGLDHNEGLGQILPGEVVPVIGRFIWTVIEDLQEWGASQVEDELHQKEERDKKHQPKLPKLLDSSPVFLKSKFLGKKSTPCNSSGFFPYQSLAALNYRTSPLN